jgi:hypothetical protein
MSNENACMFGMDWVHFISDRSEVPSVFSAPRAIDVLHLSLAFITNSNIPPSTPTRTAYLNKDRSTVKRMLRDVHFVAGCCEGDMYANEYSTARQSDL